MTEIRHRTSSGTIFGYLNYGYNTDGLVTDVIEGDGSVVTYNYDPVFRLIGEQRVGSYPYTVTYEYDPAGNRTARMWGGQRTSYSYDRADRLLSYTKPDGSTVTYNWDRNGNILTRTESGQRTQFAHNFDNRMTRITYPDGSQVQFVYDGLGRRVRRVEGTVVRQFFYDGDKVIAEREGSQWVVRYLLGPTLCGFVRSGSVSIYHPDRLGSIRWLTDSTQNVFASYTYEGFGKIVGQNGIGGGAYLWCGLWGYRND
ncbi:MAG: hypothetical protein RMK62_10905, partial [Armatimonadota bacterium]|nr:hypothetical protein [Armatimonadota bacterium]